MKRKIVYIWFNNNRSITYYDSYKGECSIPYGDAPSVIPEQYEYHWIDLDEYYQSLNGLNSISGTPEEL